MAKGNEEVQGPQVPTPEEEARGRIMEMEAQARLDQEAADRQRMLDEQERMRKEGETTEGTQQAYNSALQYGSNRLNSSGIQDNYGIMDTFRGEADFARSQVPKVTGSPGSYFTPSTWYDSAVGGARTRERGRLGSEFDTFAGMGFDRNMIGDTMDDDVINSILGQQKGDALYQLDAAKARGKFNDAGYSRGLSELENMFRIGQSKAQDLGGGVLEGYRGQLRNRADNYRNQLSNWDFGSSYSNTRAQDDLGALGASFRGSLEGDVLRAIGETNFFDVGKLFGKAGERSGVINPSVSGTSPLGTGGNSTNPMNNRTLETSVF